MKKLICVAVCAFCMLLSSAAEINMQKLFTKMRLPAFSVEKDFPKFGVQPAKSISSGQLAAINYILKHTYENNIHKMRGEEENKVYVRDDGVEAVYDANGNLVTNYNKGTYNYASYDKPVDKFLLDFLPWILLGVSRDDPTSFEERLYYYCMDLNWGIQSYIFLDDKNELEQFSYDELSAKEKIVYQLFSYLIFNKNYEIRMEDKNIPRLREDENFYWAYFDQIMKIAGFKEK